MGRLWRALRGIFRADEADEADAATFRARQLQAVLRLMAMAMAMAVNVTNAVIICSVLWAPVAPSPCRPGRW